MKLRTSLYLSAISTLCLSTTQGAMIANWKQLNSGGGIPLSGATTDSPTYGDGTSSSAVSSFIAGRFGTTASPQTINLSVGQTLTVIGNLVLTGGSGGDNQYRFGIFNDGGQFAVDASSGWTGGWMHQAGDDIFQGRTDGAYISSNGNAVPLGASKTSTGTLDQNSAVPLTFSMSITRDSGTTVDIASSFTGGGGSLDQNYTANNVTTANFTYTSFGALFGGSSNLDQGSFSNVQFSVVPEPSSALLLYSGIGIFFLRRRR